jgi:hypothetical protein
MLVTQYLKQSFEIVMSGESFVCFYIDSRTVPKVGMKGKQEFFVSGYDTIQTVESQPTFQRNMSSPSSGMKSKPSKKPA